MEETETEPTITIVLGSDMKPVRKPIEFHRVLDSDETFEPVYEDRPCHWKYIELICKEYLGTKTLDLMYAYDDPKDRSRGRLFLGQWNSGYVER
jgi:hypothetical protein